MRFHGTVDERTPVHLRPPTFDDVEAERQHRKARLAGAYRIFSRLGYDHWVTGHITVRDPGRPDHFWVNPFGIRWDAIRASDLLLVSADGEVVVGDLPVNGAAFAVHAAVHHARPDVQAVAHAHTPGGSTWSATGRPIEPITQDACVFYEDHAVFDEYEGVVYGTAEADRIAKALGATKAAILRHHGLLTVGETVDEAAFWLHLLDRQCQAHLALAAVSPGEPLPRIGHDNAAMARKQVGEPLHGWLGFQPLWERLVAAEPDVAD